jgi:hypothetical protein
MINSNTAGDSQIWKVSKQLIPSYFKDLLVVKAQGLALRHFEEGISWKLFRFAPLAARDHVVQHE